MEKHFELSRIELSQSAPAAPVAAPAPSRKRLLARPRLALQAEKFAAPVPGLHALGLGEERDGCLYIPEKAAEKKFSPLLVLLHGANGDSTHILQHFRSHADETGLILLAPESRKKTWDVVRGAIGEDLEFVDRALETVFSRYAIRSSQIALGGFSDGASYALSLGIPNASLFSHVLAFSPSFVAPFEIDSSLKIFVSHGLEDRVCAIDRCSRRIVPYLQRTGFDLQYREFNGGHGIPEAVAREAVSWFLAPNHDGLGF